MVHRIGQLMAAAGLLTTIGLLRGGTDRDPREVFSQAREKVLASANRAIDYTCVQTIERTYYRSLRAHESDSCPLVLGTANEPAKAFNLQWVATDRLRLDVTLASLGEIFAWAGESRFEDKGIDTVVRDGPIGSGSFASYLNMILFRDAKTIRYDGHKLVNGTNLMEYTFRVGALDSHYYVRHGEAQAPTGYFGSIFIDPIHEEVVRLYIETVRPDAIGGSCQTSSTLDFGTQEIAAEPFQLPVRAHQIYLRSDGGEIINASTFAKCREYRGESTIKFEAPPGVTAKEATLNDRRVVPPGVSFSLLLSEPIDTSTAAAGDHFHATLFAALRDEKRRVLAPAGSIVEGRIRRVEQDASPPMVFIVLSPESVQSGNQRLILGANRERNWRAKGHEIVVPRFGEGPGGVFQMDPKAVLPQGFQSDWVTVKVETK